MGSWFVLEQNVEIEYKNLLNEEEYRSILEAEFSDVEQPFIHQINYYFDTENSDLKQQQSALRIRVTDSYHELTLKVPHQGFLMEYNHDLRDNDISEIINEKQLMLSSILSSDNNFPNLENITKDTIFYLFNSFRTERLEKQVDDHLIVLDRTFYQDGSMDYELEIESLDVAEGKKFFDLFLERYEIQRRPANPKIQRAEEHKSR